MTALAAARAEWLKLRKRPGLWIMTITLAAIVMLFGYVLVYVTMTQAPAEALGTVIDPEMIRESLVPANLPSQVLGLVAALGIVFGLILGALTVGSEYGWQTVKTITTQRPGRLALMAARAAALLGVCVLFAVVAFVAGAAGSAVVSLLEPLDRTLPLTVDVATAFGVAVLIFAVWCGLGACLAMLFRGTAWSIGVGLLYAFVLEYLLGQVLQGRIGEMVSQALIGNNISALVLWLSPDSLEGLAAIPVDIDPLQAILVLLAYLGVAAIVTTVVFVRRDIT
jgi:ABC-type transport system involved in multi-copper enzyme maturation permease subunit